MDVRAGRTAQVRDDVLAWVVALALLREPGDVIASTAAILHRDPHVQLPAERGTLSISDGSMLLVGR